MGFGSWNWLLELSFFFRRPLQPTTPIYIYILIYIYIYIYMCVPFVVVVGLVGWLM